MKIIITALTAMLLLFSCGKNNYKETTIERLQSKSDETNNSIGDSEPEGILDYRTDSAGAPQITQSDKQKQPVAKTTTNPDWNKKIIKTATLSFEVKDFKTYYTSLQTKIKNAGGYIAEEQQNQTDYKIENTISIKVPVDQFETAVNALTTDVEKITEKRITSQDVTGEFVDTRSRIEAKKQVRQRYMELLGQAKSMADILSVQSEINSVQEEIESANGRINYLGHSSAYSTINLTYFQVINESAKDSNKPSFGTEVGQAFKTGWGWVVDLFVALVTIWPLVLVTVLAVFLIKKLRLQKPRQA